jgi:hypothetical protein
MRQDRPRRVRAQDGSLYMPDVARALDSRNRDRSMTPEQAALILRSVVAGMNRYDAYQVRSVAQWIDGLSSQTA